MERYHEKRANGRVNEDEEECSFFRIEIIDPRSTIRNCPGNNILSFLIKREREGERESYVGQLHPDLERVNLPATRANYFPVFSYPYYPGSSLRPCGNQTTKPCIRGWNPSGPFPVKNLSFPLNFSLRKTESPRLSLHTFAVRYYFYHFHKIIGEYILEKFSNWERYDRCSRFYETNWQSCLSPSLPAEFYSWGQVWPCLEKWIIHFIRRDYALGDTREAERMTVQSSSFTEYASNCFLPAWRIFIGVQTTVCKTCKFGRRDS